MIVLFTYSPIRQNMMNEARIRTPKEVIDLMADFFQWGGDWPQRLEELEDAEDLWRTALAKADTRIGLKIAEHVHDVKRHSGKVRELHHYYVLAENIQTYQEWVLITNPEKAIFVDDVHILSGVWREFSTVVFIGRYRNRPDLAEILRLIHIQNLRCI